MSVAEVLAGEDGPFTTPHDYTLSPGEAFEPTTVAVTFDGSGAAGTFMPCLSFFSQDGRLLGRSFPSSTVAAGNSAVVTYSPFALTASSVAGGGGSETRRDRATLTNPLQSADAGNAFPTVLPVTGGDLGLWEFLNGVEGVVLGNVLVPHAYSSGGKLVLAIFCHAGAAANVRLDVGTRVVSAGDVLVPIAFTLESDQIIAMATNDKLVVVSFTLSTTLVADAVLLFEVIRRGNLGMDTLAQPLYLIGAWLETTVSG